MGDGQTPDELLRGNMAAVMARRGLTQPDLAARMQALGYKWIRQTVGDVQTGRRGLRASELYGLALALELPITTLVVPWADVEEPSVRMPSGLILDFTTQFRIRNVPWAPIMWEGNTPKFKATDRLHTMEQSSVHRAEDRQQPVVAAIVTSDRGVLVGRRVDGRPPWTFIAGEQDAVKDENPADTAVREVKEETGLRVQAGDLIGERVHPKTGRTMIYIAAAPTHGTEVFVGDEDELAEVRWVSLAEADELLPGMYGPVREHLAREIGGS
jgi:8-oxo-dGTP diphosphatase